MLLHTIRESEDFVFHMINLNNLIEITLKIVNLKYL